MSETQKQGKSVKLEVAEALRMDVGRGIARIDSKTMDALGVQVGQAILLKGSQEAIATVWRARPEDDGLNIVRVDGITRANAGTSMGEKVDVLKIDVVTAKQITIAPTEEVRFSGDPSEYFHERMLERCYVQGNKISIDVFGTTFHFLVTKTMPKGAVRVTEETQVVVSDTPAKMADVRIPDVSYEDIGGLREEITKVREMIELPLKHPEVFETLGIGAPKGVLLYGPPGTGKTLLAKAVANEAEASFFSIAGPEIMNKYYGESEKGLRDLFDNAAKQSPSIIFIDEIDAIAPKREEAQGELERRVVSQLLTLMDGLKSRGQVIVIAATNRPDSIDEALRRPGRFDREIQIGVPDKIGRKEILEIHTRGMPLESDVDLQKLADITLGYTGADLEALAKEAALRALRKYLPEIQGIKGEKKVPPELLSKIKVTMQHFMEAYRSIEPSAMREVLIQRPTTTWDEIGGLEGAKQELIEMVEWPLKSPEDFARIGIKPPKGILISGPPGTGKTLLAKAVANESQANFIAVKGPELISKFVGESEKHIREVFKRARQVAPSIVFFDEFDSIAGVRGNGFGSDSGERIVNQLLTEMDGIEELQGVVVIAATNRKDLIDPALLRSGRIDRHVEIQLPDEKTRLAILKVHTKGMPLGKGIGSDDLARRTDGFSGADLEALVREAGMFALRRNKKTATVEKEDVEKGLLKIAESKGIDLSKKEEGESLATKGSVVNYTTEKMRAEKGTSAKKKEDVE